MGKQGIVLFAHGSGSSRLSPRNQFVAKYLEKAGIKTHLFDLLSEEEDTQERRFDILLLAERLIEEAEKHEGPIAFFGASTGAAAALVAASQMEVAAVVSRGGRPDLAKEALAKVKAPTLLIVGGNDEVVIDLNREAYALLACEKKMEIVPGATHLFEEPGTLEQVAELAKEWFLRH
ncbi:MAG: putative phosphoribosyl transferase [Chlamydiae bacterium]|nr:putative phosphoribosyl transferase [Chlamydiota bacterium]